MPSPSERARLRIEFLREANRTYLKSEHGDFPTPEEAAVLELIDDLDAALPASPSDITQLVVEAGLWDLIMVAGGRMNQAGAQQRSLKLLRAGVISRALQACDLRHSDWRDVVQDMPETKGAIRKAGGDPEAIFEEVKAMFPGRPAELLDYYETGRTPSW